MKSLLNDNFIFYFARFWVSSIDFEIKSQQINVIFNDRKKRMKE